MNEIDWKTISALWPEIGDRWFKWAVSGDVFLTGHIQNVTFI